MDGSTELGRTTAAGGVTLRAADTLLVSRALDYLSAGPSTTVDLVRHVCQLPAPPRAVAEHLAATLLAGSPQFARTGDGRWCLAGSRFDGVGSAAETPPAAERLADLAWAVVDVETTGGRPNDGDRVTEVAAVVVRGGEIDEVFETLVNPQRPIPPLITSLTSITWEMVRDAPTFRDVCSPLAERLRGRVFVAHNVAFDWRFVCAEFARATGERLDGRRLCTVRLARRLLPQLPRRSLDHVARYFGVEIASRHRAAGDAVATARVLLKLLSEARDRGCETWADLERLLEVTRGRRPSRRRPRLPRPTDGLGGA